MNRKDITPAALKGRKPRVRVFEEEGRVLAYWWEGGRRQYEVYPATAAGRVQAKAFAKGCFERLTAPPRTSRITTREMWARFVEAEGPRLRPSSMKLYGAAWRKWEVFVGAETPAEDVPTEAAARFRGAMARRHVINQVRNFIRVVKLVYAWADELEIITRNRVTRYRMKIGKDELVRSPPEFRSEEWEAILSAMGSGQHPRTWRAYCAVLLQGAQGDRINATLQLRWADVDLVLGSLQWPRATNKQGKARWQPITPEGLSALLTARWWAEKLRLRSEYVLPGSTPKAQHYTYAAYSDVLDRAEARAGIRHQRGRGSHGFRKMSAGNIHARTGDALLAMQWVGDKDPRMMEPYLKTRDDRLEALAEPVHPATLVPRQESTPSQVSERQGDR